MATVSVIKLKVRRGTDAERQQIILDEGEIGYTTDSKRLFVGDARARGGTSVGIKYYVGALSAARPNDGNISTIQTGDIVLDTTANALYILTGAPTNGTTAFQLSSVSLYSRIK